ncbi:protein-ADP-ribose hydrolase [Paenibacillus kribbensis]|uniref:protein-ADP-ribose hydrolase n=1 Tax=Paenibacillus kribbensis TaxID=172713 RepID=UPI0009FD1F58|nr:protein-ADP-ribose hydrolase [Paenibacillus kribbensis]
MKGNRVKDGYPGLKLDDYRQAILLDEPTRIINPSLLTEDQYIRAIDKLLRYFQLEGIIDSDQIPREQTEKRKLIHAVQNVRQPAPMDPSAMQAFDILLEYEKERKGIVDANKLPTLQSEGIFLKNLPADPLVLWRGDITSLDVDAIVNAANHQMLGCFQPLHSCIDNAIHTAAGPELREDCQIIMKLQGHPELTGDAKVTKAYHLPSRFVLHTVGPIVPHETPSQRSQEEELSSCYTSCLNLASQVKNIRSIAFCAISTGVFSYPKLEAAQNAIRTVSEWLQKHPERFDRIIFNVYSQEDEEVYRNVIDRYKG